MKIVTETKETEYQIFKDLKNETCITHTQDKRLKDVWKDCEMIVVIDSEQKKYYDLKTQEINSKWDKKISVDKYFNITEVDKYSPQEKEEILKETNKQQSSQFIVSEKNIALKIEEDYRLELEEITDSEMSEIKKYIKSLQPSVLTRALDRPTLMFIYEKKI